MHNAALTDMTSAFNSSMDGAMVYNYDTASFFSNLLNMASSVCCTSLHCCLCMRLRVLLAAILLEQVSVLNYVHDCMVSELLRCSASKDWITLVLAKSALPMPLCCCC